MFITKILRALPLKKQTIVKSLAIVTFLFIVYQLTFVYQLSESAKPKPLREHLPKSDKKVATKERVHPKDVAVAVIDKKVNNDKIDSSISEKKTENSSNMIKGHVPKKPNVSDIIIKVIDDKVELAEVFTCRTSGKIITKDKVDDDYCDCPEDGSDEPRTNACMNSKFSCHNAVKGFLQVVPSAWVNDGICDCCDGSDEWQKKVVDTILPLELQIKVGRFLSPCPNRCP